jgi:hypothetical protein
MVDPDDIKTLQFSLDGSPWCNVAGNSSIDTDTMEFSLDGSPWWGHVETAIASQWNMYVGAASVEKIYHGSNELTQSYIGSNALKT